MKQGSGRCLSSETLHASCVARHGQAVLLLGPSGAGKSDLALRLLDRGFRLVADDRVRLQGVMAAPPDALRGLIEVRGLGILRVEPVFPLPVVLAVELGGTRGGAPGGTVDRLPEPRIDPVLGVPVLALSPWQASTPLLVELALDCVLGRRGLLEGFVTDPQHTHGRSVTET